MRNRIGVAVACLHISAVIQAAVAVTYFKYATPADGPEGFLVPRILLAFVVTNEIVAFGLQCRKFWAWVMALLLLGGYVLSLLLPLGVIGLWGLLAPGSRAAIGFGPATQPRPDAAPAADYSLTVPF